MVVGAGKLRAAGVPPRQLSPRGIAQGNTDGAAAFGPPPLESPPVIDRDEVLHVARLARLSLSEQEIAGMRTELSAVLDHIAKIGELDLSDVPPSTHVVEVTGALRADEPRPSLPREVALASAPARTGDGFLVPSPQA